MPRLLFLFLLLLGATSASVGAQPPARVTADFNKGWKFYLGDAAGAKAATFNDAAWRRLTLPHDWSIEGKFDEKNPAKPEGGGLPTGIGWYRKTFTLPATAERNVFIEFDGVYKRSEVWLNGHLLGYRPSGYISFRYELTPYLRPAGQPNVLAVRVDNSAQPDSRWYTGSGIYREVRLVTTHQVAVDEWGTFVTTPAVSPQAATVAVQTQLRNATGRARTVSLQTVLLDKTGREAARQLTSGVKLSDTATTVAQHLTLKNPQLWSVTQPYLYRVKTTVLVGQAVEDEYATPLGVRTCVFTKAGFQLNGQPLRVQGVNQHHDLGALGAAFNVRAAERQLEILKKMGCNAIRMSHNPPAPQLLDLCDRMGLLVLDEAFDMWQKKKNSQDYHLDFKQWHRRDLEDQIRRDRNHPSVFLWSIGNEIREQFDSTGTRLTRELTAIVKRLDPTRPVTSALTEQDPAKNFISQAGVLDVLSFNYKHAEYPKLPASFPERPFLATEIAAAYETRGHYDLPADSLRIWPKDGKSKLIGGNADFTASSYDNAAPFWGATHEAAWRGVRSSPFISGAFVWSGFDYLGEPLPYLWPARSSYFGIIDLAGFPKDAYYLYQSEWTSRPVLHLLPHWNWQLGQLVDVWAYYSQADEVELFLNGKSLGIKKKSPDDLHVLWRVPYAPGTLQAVSRRAGQTVLTRTVATAGPAARIELTADRHQLQSNGKDLSFVTVRVLDAAGHLVPDAANLVKFTVSGPGFVAGVDNGYQASMESFKAPERKAYNGMAVAMVQTTEKGGAITLRANAEGLMGATVTLNSAAQTAQPVNLTRPLWGRGVRCHVWAALLLLWVSKASAQEASVYFFPNVSHAPTVYPGPETDGYQVPQLTEINRDRARATAYSFTTEKDALTGDRSRTTRLLSLSGLWDFSFASKPTDAPRDFYKSRVRGWQQLAVPSNWELNGYDLPIYKSAKYPFRPVDPPFVPQDYNGVGSYQRSFTVPAGWQNQNVTLHFGGVSSAFKVWVNGKFLGYGEDSCLPSEFNVTPYLQSGENVVSVQVLRWSDGSYLEDQDHWRLSGIFREVLLLAEPRLRIADFHWQAKLDKEYKDAVLSIRPRLENLTGNNDLKGYEVKAQLYDGTGRPVLGKTLQITADGILNEKYPRLDNAKFGLLETTVRNPAKWSDEAPNLYTLVLTLTDPTGAVLEAKSCRVGFRSIEFSKENGKLLINGKLTYLYGVNRHDHHPTKGMAVSRDDIRDDVRTLKQFNFNCIRTSHYPNDPYFYDLCDEYGILVIDEANLETHGLGSKLSNDPAWAAAYQERSMRMALRDKNHPSIIFWSLGNESGRGPNHAAMAAWLRDFDITRPIHYEPAQGDPHLPGYLDPSDPNYPKNHAYRVQVPRDQPYVDMVSRMYPGLFTGELLANQANGDQRPIFFCEYAHSMGNATGNMKEFWDGWRATKRVIGGCIWEFKDQGLLKKDSTGTEFYAYGGDFQEKYYDDFTIKGIVASDGRPHAAIYECKRVYQPLECTLVDAAKALVKVENRAALLNADAYAATLIVRENGRVVSTRPLPRLRLAAGRDTVISLSKYLPKLKPGAEYLANVSFALPQATAWAAAGHEVATNQLALTGLAQSKPITTKQPAVTVRNESAAYRLSGKDFQVTIDKASGALTSYRYRGTEQLAAPLLPHFTRPLTDNDRRGWKADKKLKEWFAAEPRLQSLTLDQSNASQPRLTSTYSLIDGKTTARVTYTLNGDGTLKVDYALAPTAGLPNIPRVGMQLGIRRSYDNISFYGRGPLENYIDRRYGFDAGIYTQPLSAFADSYVVPMEYANRTDVRWMQLADKQNTGLLVVADSLLSMSAWPYTEQNIRQARHTNRLKDAGFITLNIDLAQMGVGGNTSWDAQAAPIDKYQLPAKPYRYSFYLRPVSGQPDAGQRAQSVRFDNQNTSMAIQPR